MSTLTIEDYDHIATELRRIKSEISPLFDLAWSNESFHLGRDLADIQQTLQGLIYMSSPQTEWTGGDSSNPKNYKRNPPHIDKLS